MLSQRPFEPLSPLQRDLRAKYFARLAARLRDGQVPDDDRPQDKQKPAGSGNPTGFTNAPQAASGGNGGRCRHSTEDR